MTSSGNRSPADRVVEALTARDWDLYALIGAAAILAGVSIWHGEWTTGLFAGTLGGIALSLIRVRHDLASRGKPVGIASIFKRETPADVIPSFDRATDLVLVGVSLDRALRDAYRPLEQFLQRGGTLRVILVNPENEWAIRTADNRAYLVHGHERRREHVEQSIATFNDLREQTGGSVAMRIVDDPLTFGATMIDGDRNTAESRIIIQHYSYKKPGAREPNPVFVIRPSDGDWFGDFKEEVENLWRDAKPAH